MTIGLLNVPCWFSAASDGSVMCIVQRVICSAPGELGNACAQCGVLIYCKVGLPWRCPSGFAPVALRREARVNERRVPPVILQAWCL